MSHYQILMSIIVAGILMFNLGSWLRPWYYYMYLWPKIGFKISEGIDASESDCYVRIRHRDRSINTDRYILLYGARREGRTGISWQVPHSVPEGHVRLARANKTITNFKNAIEVAQFQGSVAAGWRAGREKFIALASAEIDGHPFLSSLEFQKKALALFEFKEVQAVYIQELSMTVITDFPKLETISPDATRNFCSALLGLCHTIRNDHLTDQEYIFALQKADAALAGGVTWVPVTENNTSLPQAILEGVASYSFLFPICGPFLFFWSVYHYPSLRWDPYITGGLFGLGAAIINVVWTLREASQANVPKSQLGYVLILPGLLHPPMLISLAIGVALSINGFHLQSPGERVEAVVVSKSTEFKYVEIAARGDMSSGSVKLDRTDYNKLNPGDTMMVLIKNGRLGSPVVFLP